MHDFSESLEVLRRDRRIAKLIERHGPPILKRPGADNNVFRSLLRAIIYQQLSGKAARAIHLRTLALISGKPTPEALLALSEKQLRGAGLSTQKIAYVRDLARKCSDGTIEPKRLRKMSSEGIVEHLRQIKGVGEWTAHMLLIFTLHRLDILPIGDLGVRKGFQLVYNLKALPDKSRMEALSRGWRAHASIGAWYLWKAADEAKKSEFSDW